MSARGPLPIPTPILEARGSTVPGRRAKKRREDSGEPRPPVEAPAAPDWLSEEAAREWKRQTRYLKQVRCIARCDRAMLAVYCAAWGEFVRAQRLIGEALLLKVGDDPLAVHPLLAVRDRAAERLIKCATHFGFSPAARARVRSQPAEAKDDGEAPKLYKIR